MGFRFTRRVSIIPGLRANLSKSGASLSLGGRGHWLTVGPRGRRVTLGIPGTGIFWTENIPPSAPPHAGHRSAFGLVVILLALAAVLCWAAATRLAG
jgi:Protein of unknown function (DUF4236)